MVIFFNTLYLTANVAMPSIEKDYGEGVGKKVELNSLYVLLEYLCSILISQVLLTIPQWLETS